MLHSSDAGRQTEATATLYPRSFSKRNALRNDCTKWVDAQAVRFKIDKPASTRSNTIIDTVSREARPGTAELR